MFVENSQNIIISFVTFESILIKQFFSLINVPENNLK